MEESQTRSSLPAVAASDATAADAGHALGSTASGGRRRRSSRRAARGTASNPHPQESRAPGFSGDRPRLGSAGAEPAGAPKSLSAPSVASPSSSAPEGVGAHQQFPHHHRRKGSPNSRTAAGKRTSSSSSSEETLKTEQLNSAGYQMLDTGTAMSGSAAASGIAAVKQAAGKCASHAGDSSCGVSSVAKDTIVRGGDECQKTELPVVTASRRRKIAATVSWVPVVVAPPEYDGLDASVEPSSGAAPTSGGASSGIWKSGISRLPLPCADESSCGGKLLDCNFKFLAYVGNASAPVSRLPPHGQQAPQLSSSRLEPQARPPPPPSSKTPSATTVPYVRILCQQTGQTCGQIFAGTLSSADPSTQRRASSSSVVRSSARAASASGGTAEGRLSGSTPPLASSSPSRKSSADQPLTPGLANGLSTPPPRKPAPQSSESENARGNVLHQTNNSSANAEAHHSSSSSLPSCKILDLCCSTSDRASFFLISESCNRVILSRILPKQSQATKFLELLIPPDLSLVPASSFSSPPPEKPLSSSQSPRVVGQLLRALLHPQSAQFCLSAHEHCIILWDMAALRRRITSSADSVEAVLVADESLLADCAVLLPLAGIVDSFSQVAVQESADAKPSSSNSLLEGLKSVSGAETAKTAEGGSAVTDEAKSDGNADVDDVDGDDDDDEPLLCDVCFTPEGAYLLAVLRPSVVVAWSLRLVPLPGGTTSSLAAQMLGARSLLKDGVEHVDSIQVVTHKMAKDCSTDDILNSTSASTISTPLEAESKRHPVVVNETITHAPPPIDDIIIQTTPRSEPPSVGGLLFFCSKKLLTVSCHRYLNPSPQAAANASEDEMENASLYNIIGNPLQLLKLEPILAADVTLDQNRADASSQHLRTMSSGTCSGVQAQFSVEATGSFLCITVAGLTADTVPTTTTGKSTVCTGRDTASDKESCVLLIMEICWDMLSGSPPTISPRLPLATCRQIPVAPPCRAIKTFSYPVAASSASRPSGGGEAVSTTTAPGGAPSRCLCCYMMQQGSATSEYQTHYNSYQIPFEVLISSSPLIAAAPSSVVIAAAEKCPDIAAAASPTDTESKDQSNSCTAAIATTAGEVEHPGSADEPEVAIAGGDIPVSNAKAAGAAPPPRSVAQTVDDPTAVPSVTTVGEVDKKSTDCESVSHAEATKQPTVAEEVSAAMRAMDEMLTQRDRRLMQTLAAGMGAMQQKIADGRTEIESLVDARVAESMGKILTDTVKSAAQDAVQSMTQTLKEALVKDIASLREVVLSDLNSINEIVGGRLQGVFVDCADHLGEHLSSVIQMAFQDADYRFHSSHIMNELSACRRSVDKLSEQHNQLAELVGDRLHPSPPAASAGTTTGSADPILEATRQAAEACKKCLRTTEALEEKLDRTHADLTGQISSLLVHRDGDIKQLCRAYKQQQRDQGKQTQSRASNKFPTAANQLPSAIFDDPGDDPTAMPEATGPHGAATGDAAMHTSALQRAVAEFVSGARERNRHFDSRGVQLLAGAAELTSRLRLSAAALNDDFGGDSGPAEDLNDLFNNVDAENEHQTPPQMPPCPVGVPQHLHREVTHHRQGNLMERQLKRRTMAANGIQAASNDDPYDCDRRRQLSESGPALICGRRGKEAFGAAGISTADLVSARGAPATGSLLSLRQHAHEAFEMSGNAHGVHQEFEMPEVRSMVELSTSTPSSPRVKYGANSRNVDCELAAALPMENSASEETSRLAAIAALREGRRSLEHSRQGGDGAAYTTWNSTLKLSHRAAVDSVPSSLPSSGGDQQDMSAADGIAMAGMQDDEDDVVADSSDDPTTEINTFRPSKGGPRRSPGRGELAGSLHSTEDPRRLVRSEAANGNFGDSGAVDDEEDEEELLLPPQAKVGQREATMEERETSFRLLRYMKQLQYDKAFCAAMVADSSGAKDGRWVAELCRRMTAEQIFGSARHGSRENDSKPPVEHAILLGIAKVLTDSVAPKMAKGWLGVEELAHRYRWIRDCMNALDVEDHRVLSVDIGTFLVDMLANLALVRIEFSEGGWLEKLGAVDPSGWSGVQQLEMLFNAAQQSVKRCQARVESSGLGMAPYVEQEDANR